MKKLLLLSAVVASVSFGAVTITKVKETELLKDTEVVTDISGVASQESVDEALDLAGDVATLIYGDDCQLVSTNYNSKTKLPSLFLRFKIKDENTGEMVWYKVWDEMTRWNWLFDTYMPSNHYTKAELDIALDEKADRAWGHYDSHTGNYAPDGFTWVSSPKIAIAGGMSYQRIVNSGNGIFVLCSNGLVTELGNEASVTNGFFRIEDDKGNAIFEITKGTASYTPATADDIVITNIMGIAHMYIPYKVKCPEPLKIFACTDLTKKDWKREDEEGFLFNVNWTGESGNWLAEVWAKNPSDTGFVKAEYKVGAEDIIRHNAPMSVGKLKVEGDDKIYKVKIVTINGIKVLGVDE